MLKVIDFDQSFFHGEPSVNIIDFNSSKGLIKAAADSRISEFASTLTPHPDRIYIHILAMGAGEYFGANRNADYFPEDNLKQWFKTFETSPAHIFKHHINKDPSIAMGQVVFAIYNERMHRVEVIAWVDRQKAYDYVAKIERGEFPATSMACHTPFDTCSICKNKARSRAEYCVHLREKLGRTYPDGRKVMAINDGPLKFFDMSMVFRPADVTSGVLQKVASSGLARQVPVIGSAEQAEALGISEKVASLKKLSDLIKEVEGEVVGSASSLDALLSKIKDPDDDILHFLIHYDIDDVLHAFADLGISPSVRFFAKLIGQKLCGEDVAGIEHLVAGLMKEEPAEINVPHMIEKASSYASKAAIISKLTPMVKQCSLLPEQVMERAFAIAPLPPQSKIGYSGLGPTIEPDPAESYRKMKSSLEGENAGMLKTLFTIAGAAIATKWLLTQMIERKMQQIAAQKQHNSNSAVKIVLVKSAEDALTAKRLTKADFLANLKNP